MTSEGVSASARVFCTSTKKEAPTTGAKSGLLRVPFGGNLWWGGNPPGSTLALIVCLSSATNEIVELPLIAATCHLQPSPTISREDSGERDVRSSHCGRAFFFIAPLQATIEGFVAEGSTHVEEVRSGTGTYRAALGPSRCGVLRCPAPGQAWRVLDSQLGELRWAASI